MQEYIYDNSELVTRYDCNIYDDENLICRASLIINRRPKLGQSVGLIEDVWTDEHYRKQGYASKAIHELVKKAKEENCYKVILHCANHNLSFYTKLGFKIWQNSMRINIE